MKVFCVVTSINSQLKSRSHKFTSSCPSHAHALFLSGLQKEKGNGVEKDNFGNVG